MKKFLASVLVLLLLASILGACGRGAAPTEEKKVSPAAPAAPDVGWKQKWESIVAEAKKEGKISLYTSQRPKAREAMTKAIKESFGIDLEIVVGRPDEVVARLKAERASGQYLADIAMLGIPSFISDLVPMGMLAPLDPVIILPEIRDPSLWRGGKLPYFDKEKMGFKIVTLANPIYTINTEMVKADELKYSIDLLNPKWKGKIAMGDPGIAGTANTWFENVVLEILGMEKGLQFMKDLLKQEPTMTRDDRMLVEWIAKGKYAIGIGCETSTVAQFIRLGSPVAFAGVEPKLLTPGSAMVNMFKDAPHPNAAKLFVNWILSKEGGTVFAPASEWASNRVDVPIDYVLPAMVERTGDVDPAEKYPEYLARRAELRKIAGETFGGLLK